MKQFRQQFKQQQRPKKSSLANGIVAVLQAINDGKTIDKIYINNKVSESNFSEIFELSKKSNIPIQKVPPEKLKSFNIDNTDGCIGLLSKLKYQDIQTIIDWNNDNGVVSLFLILDGITDVRNIGAMARTAYALGVQAIIIPDKGVAALNEDAILTSAGALEQIAVCRVQSLMKLVDTLHLNGIKVFASEMQAKNKIESIAFDEPCAIVMGSEENGIFPALMKQCDAQFFIPMHNNFESLNVSVATGIILYEVQKQRNG